MNIRYIFKQPKVQKSIPFFLLFWLLGLCFGISLAFFSTDRSADLLCSSMAQSASPASALLVGVLPIAILATAIKYSLFWAACPLILLTGIWRGYCGMLIFIAFYHGAWLLRSLFLFSAGIEAVLIWFLLIRNYTTTGQTFKQDLRLIAVVYLITFAIDQLFISPFLSDLVKYI